MNELGLGVMLNATNSAGPVMGQFAGQLQQLAGMPQKIGQGFKAGAEMSMAGIAMMSAGMAGLHALSGTTASAREFGRAVAEVATETTEAAFPMQKIHDLAIDLSMAYGKAPVEEAAGLYQAIAAGAADAATASSLLHGANKLAIGGATDTTTAIDGLSSALNAYGQAFTDSNIVDASNAFFVAMHDGKTKVGELASTIGRVAPTAANLGVSFTDLLASISAITAPGIKTEEAVTGLKAALSNIIKPTSDAAAEATRLGIKFDQAALRAKGFPGFIKSITSATGFNNESFSKLFGSVEALNAVMALTANDGAKFKSVLEDMEKRTGASDDAFSKMAVTLDFAGDKFQALKEVSSTIIGETLTPMLSKTLKWTSSFMEAFNKLSPAMRGMAIRFAAVASTVAVVVGGLSSARSVFGAASVVLERFGLAGSLSVSSLLPLLGVVAAIGLAFATFKVAYEGNIGGFAPFIDNLVSKVRLGFAALGQLVSQGGFSGKVLADLENGNQGVEAFATQIWLVGNRIVEFFRGIGRGFAAMLGSTTTFESFTGALGRLATALNLTQDSTTVAGQTFDRFGEIGESVGGHIGKAVDMIMQVVTAVTEAVGGFIGRWRELGPVFAPIGDAIQELHSTFSGFTVDFLGSTQEVGGTASIWSQLGSVIATTIGDAISIVGSLIRDLAKVFGGVVDIIVGLLSGDFTRAWEGVQRVIAGAINASVDAVLGLVQVLANAIDQMGNFAGKDWHFGDKIRGWRDGMKGGLLTTDGIDKRREEADNVYRPTARVAEAVAGAGRAAGAYLPEAAPATLVSTAQTVISSVSSAQSGAANLDVPGLNMSIGQLVSAKMGGVSLNGSIIMDGAAVGEIVASGQRGPDNLTSPVPVEAG